MPGKAETQRHGSLRQGRAVQCRRRTWVQTRHPVQTQGYPLAFCGTHLRLLQYTMRRHTRDTHRGHIGCAQPQRRDHPNRRACRVGAPLGRSHGGSRLDRHGLRLPRIALGFRGDGLFARCALRKGRACQE